MKYRPIQSQCPDRGHSRAHDTVQINIGIDFGTRFTKVCYRNLNTEESYFLQVDKDGHARSIFPSIVNISDNESLSVDFEGDRPSSDRLVPYLKMRLARSRSDAQESDRSFHEVQALSAFYIARVIGYAKNAYNAEHAQRALWSANVGVPVSHFDSPHLDVFRRVCAVAWCWADQNIVPNSVRDAMNQYAKILRDVSIETSDCHAVPELVGAILSFVTDRGAQPGPYIYLDVGGGTVDGVAFRFDNQDGDTRISCYSSAITDLGVDGLVRRFKTIEQDLVRRMLERNSGPDAKVYQKLLRFKHPLQQLVAEVVVSGNRNDPERWERERRVRAPHARTVGRGREIVPLAVFLGGGGARSGWYRDMISRTHSEFQHGRLGIPEYRLTRLPPPPDLKMTDAQESQFDRLAVAYGLSVPAGENPDYLGPHLFHGPLPTEYADPPVDVISFDHNHSVFE